MGTEKINFYPRSPCGERRERAPALSQSSAFLSTLSLRRATVDALELANAVLFLSTLSLRRATFNPLETLVILPFLSTLSLRRATMAFCVDYPKNTYFYPRSPCGERRIGHINKTRSKNFYPRSPCGERHDYGQCCTRARGISIHALLAESDSRPKDLKSRRMVFLSTLSLRRATVPETLVPRQHQKFLSTLSLRRATVAPVLAVGSA